MCWKYHFPTDRLFGCYVGQINMPSPAAEDISDADAFVDPFHIGNICTLIPTHGWSRPGLVLHARLLEEDEGGYEGRRNRSIARLRRGAGRSSRVNGPSAVQRRMVCRRRSGSVARS